MNENIYAKITGILFITATAAGLTSAILQGTVLEEADYLSKIASNTNLFYMTAFFEMIMAFAGASIAISMYPVLKKYNEGLAIGAVGFRLFEGALFLVGTLFLLLLIPISKTGSSSIGDVFKSALPWTIGGIAFTIGAFMYYIVFYQSKLIPRWLSVFGLIVVVLSCIAYLTVFFNFDIGDTETLLHFPTLIQEMILAVWLIVKGYNE